jgi:hypothetical protein
VMLCVNSLVVNSVQVRDTCRKHWVVKGFIIPLDFARDVFSQWWLGGMCAWGGGPDGVVTANIQ